MYRSWWFALLRTQPSACEGQCYLLFGVIGVLPLELLQLRCAGRSGLFISAGSRWSAVHGSFIFSPSPHIQQRVAVSLINFAALRYA